MVGRVADAVVLSDAERRFLEGQVRRPRRHGLCRIAVG
ncbi:hypothetical protein RKLH11_3997 [Rhodobacteraceae bacterium KLH11]|nr:hypothetical protein RKLH11_3997 [Rhodobacteraceae bacterium KLH11]